MKRLYKIIICVAIVASNMSCSKFLDINSGEFRPLKESFYKTEDDFKSALLGSYAILTNGNLYGNRFNGRVGLEVDEGASAYNTDGNGTSIGLYKNINSTNTLIYEVYNQLYKGARNASTILSTIDDASMPAGVERDHIKGQAYFLRAYYYFFLVNLFGDIPVVPFTDGFDQEIYSVSRTPQREVLEFVVQDLKHAADLLKPMSEVGTGVQASKSAAWGLLARVYLKMGGNPINEPSAYAEAATYAKKVIDEGYHQLNPSYEDIFKKLATDLFDPKEVIFEVNFMGNYVGAVEEKTGSMQGRNNGILNRFTGAGAFLGYSEGVVVGTPYLYSLYNIVPQYKDVRFNYNMATYIYNTSTGVKRTYAAADLLKPAYSYIRFCGKFRRENELTSTPYDKSYGPQNVSILRYSDVLLMYAEALIRANPNDAGKYAEAMEYVNQVRRRSIPEGSVNRELPTTIPAVNQDLIDLYGQENVIIKDIIEERARELCFEGIRKFDLNRWGIFYKRAQQMLAERLAVVSNSPTNTAITGVSVTGVPTNSVSSSVVYYQSIEPQHSLWPIPQVERSLNPNLTQNEGY